MSDSSSVNELLKQAAAHFKSGNVAAAKTILREILKTDPNNADAWFLISRTTTDRGQKIQALERALKINPDHAHALRDIEKLRATADSVGTAVIRPQSNVGAQTTPSSSAPKAAKPGLFAAIAAIAVILVIAVVGVLLLGLNRNAPVPTVMITNAVAANNPTALPTTFIPPALPSTPLVADPPTAVIATEVPPTAASTALPTATADTSGGMAVDSPDEVVKIFFNAAQKGDLETFLGALNDSMKVRIKSIYSDPIKGFTKYFDNIQQIANLSISVTKQSETTADVTLQFHGAIKGADADYCQEYTLDNLSAKWGINAISAPLDCRRNGPDGTVKVFFTNAQLGQDTKDMLSDKLRASIIVATGSVSGYLKRMYPKFKEIKEFSVSNVSSDGDTATVMLRVHTTVKEAEGDYCQKYSLQRAVNIWLITGFGNPALCES